MAAAQDCAEIGAERDFYRRLLELGRAEEVEPLLDQALALIVEATGARAAYLELGNPDGEGRAPLWKAHGYSEQDVSGIRDRISRGIVAKTLALGRTVATPSAVADPSFRDGESVLRNRIQAVLCAPVGTPPIGVVYLQGPEASERFPVAHRDHVEWFARQLAPLADRLLGREARPDGEDHTRDLRGRFRCDGILGRSEALARALRDAALVAPLSIGVLLTGPAGTGKSVLARAIAANGPRATAPFVALNCAALPEGLLESELFGAERGAHSTATQRMPGKVAAAQGGTLFLDEIGEVPLSAQAKLLQLLEERRYYPLGSSTPVTADIRIISATNADLQAKVRRKEFRDDLRYRLDVYRIAIPGLDERRDDIPLLARNFCDRACAHHGLAGLRPTRRLLVACREAAWPGQVRELANAIEAGVARAAYEQASTLDEHHVFPSAPRATSETLGYRDATQRYQRRFVAECLDRHDWNITRAAAELELTRQHLHDLLKTFSLERPSRSA